MGIPHRGAADSEDVAVVQPVPGLVHERTPRRPLQPGVGRVFPAHDPAPQPRRRAASRGTPTRKSVSQVAQPVTTVSETGLDRCQPGLVQSVRHRFQDGDARVLLLEKLRRQEPPGQLDPPPTDQFFQTGERSLTSAFRAGALSRGTSPRPSCTEAELEPFPRRRGNETPRPGTGGQRQCRLRKEKREPCPKVSTKRASSVPIRPQQIKQGTRRCPA